MAKTTLTQTGAQVQAILDKADQVIPASLGTAGQVLAVNSSGTGTTWTASGGVTSLAGKTGVVTVDDTLVANASNVLGSTGQIPYLTTAPSVDNASGFLKIAVLTEEPATRCKGYLYIVVKSSVLTLTKSGAWSGYANGVVFVRDGTYSSGTALLSQDPADPTVYPINLSVTSGHCWIAVGGQDVGTVAVTVNGIAHPADVTGVNVEGVICDVYQLDVDADTTVNLDVDQFSH